jgi:hypothetical protein
VAARVAQTAFPALLFSDMGSSFIVEIIVPTGYDDDQANW